MITPMPGAHTLKPGSASRPFFGVEAVVLRDDSSECDANEGGKLCIRKPWPGMMRTIKKTRVTRIKSMGKVRSILVTI